METVARFILTELSMAEKDASVPTIRKFGRANSTLFTQSQSVFEDA